VDYGGAPQVRARCEREVRGGLLGALLNDGSARVSVGSKRRSGAWGSGQEMRDVGASMVGCVGKRLWKGGEADRWGPRASEGEYANGRLALIERAHRSERGSGCVREETGTDNRAPPGSGRERGRERGHGLSLTRGTHLSGGSGARVLAGLRWSRPNSIFLFPGNF
jgi:hypothetical protein